MHFYFHLVVYQDPGLHLRWCPQEQTQPGKGGGDRNSMATDSAKEPVHITCSEALIESLHESFALKF